MRIYEIFNSIDGEVNRYGQGTFTTFIRMAGCNLNCNYCDTKYAQDKESGKEWELLEIAKEVNKIGCSKITITGGEPLFQREDLLHLVAWFVTNGYKVTIETNGSYPIPWKPSLGTKVNWVIDYKTPGSGMANKEDFVDIKTVCYLTDGDYIKFVICDEEDYKFAVDKVERLKKIGIHAKFAFSPVAPNLPPDVLMSWMQKDELWDIQLNVQLHKLIEVR